MGLFPRPTNPFELSLPTGPNAQVFYVDPANGSDGARGLNPRQPLKTLAEAYDRCTADQNDAVVMIGGPTADVPAEPIVWAKNFTHLVGMSADLPGMGQRCRIVNHADNDLAVLFTLSGSGCIVKNVQFFDGKDKAEDGACLLVSGSRNYFENVFVAGMGHATPAGRAGSYSCKVTGSENAFVRCTIGLDTIARTAASAELIVAGARNRWIGCEFRANSVEDTTVLVRIDNAADDLRDIQFEDCLFFNYSTNWANGIDDVFDMPAGGNTHWVILRGANQLVGNGTGWADVVTHVYSAGPLPHASFGVSLTPTT